MRCSFLAALILFACADTEDFDASLRLYEQDLRNNRAGWLLDVGRYDEAAWEFGELYAEGYQHAALGWGMALRNLGRLEESLVCLSETNDLEERALTLHALGRCTEAAALFGQLLSDDPLTLHNLAAALRDAGLPAAPLFEQAASCMAEHDPAQLFVLPVLREYAFESGDPEHAKRIGLLVEDIQDRRDQWQSEHP